VNQQHPSFYLNHCLEGLKPLAAELAAQHHIPTLACGLVDFQSSQTAFFGLSTTPSQNLERATPAHWYFDLASLTKPFVLSQVFLRYPQLFDVSMKLLLDHRGGTPAWGRLSRHSYQEYLRSFSVRSSPTLYSDLGAILLGILIEEKSGKSLRELTSPLVGKHLYHWLDPFLREQCLIPTGEREGKMICGQVNDDNAYVLGGFLPHAGLFGTVEGVMRTLLELNRSYQLIERVIGLRPLKQVHLEAESRFCMGFDTVTNPLKTLAGPGCHLPTFGFLGFTGTSFWIDSVLQKGVVILSNATLNYSHDKTGITALRRSLGSYCWNFFSKEGGQGQAK
jgi:CubicO group peptidase (beta-lactamase class C family)